VSLGSLYSLILSGPLDSSNQLKLASCQRLTHESSIEFSLVKIIVFFDFMVLFILQIKVKCLRRVSLLLERTLISVLILEILTESGNFLAHIVRKFLILLSSIILCQIFRLKLFLLVFVHLSYVVSINIFVLSFTEVIILFISELSQSLGGSSLSWVHFA